MTITRGWLIRVTGSALILGLTLWLLPTDKVWAGFRALDWRVFLGVLAVFVCGHVLSSAKWWMLCDRPVAFLAALRAHFAGLAANLCLPGVAGGDAVRAMLAYGAGAPAGSLVAGSLGDRLIDMLALGLLSALGLLFLADGGSGSAALVAQVIALLAAILAGAFYILPRAVPWLVAKVPSLPAKGLALKVAEALGILARQPGKLALALLLSAAIQALFVALTMWLASNIGANASAAAWYFAWPLAKILAVLPISLGGIGVREASLAALMAPLGADPASIVAASLIWQAVLFAAGLIGAAAWGLTAQSTLPKPETSGS